MPDTKTAVPIGRTPFLGENPRPAKMFLDTGIEQVAGHASREGHWGWDGASLETVSAIAHDPMGYWAGDMNLCRYVGNSPANRTDPLGLGPIDLIKCLWQLNDWMDKIKKEQEKCEKEGEKRRSNDPWCEVENQRARDKCRLQGLSLSAAALKACLKAATKLK